MVAKYQLGKIKSKYMIFDILSYSGNREEAGLLLLSGSRRLRRLLSQEFPIFCNIVLEQQVHIELKEIYFDV